MLVDSTAKGRGRQRNGLLAPWLGDFNCRRAGRAYNFVAEDGKTEILVDTSKLASGCGRMAPYAANAERCAAGCYDYAEVLVHILAFAEVKSMSPMRSFLATVGVCAPLAICVAAIPLRAQASAQSRPEARSGTGGLSSSDILGMVKAGVSPDVIVAKIKASPCGFDTTPAALEKLKADAVPDSVVLAMVGCSPAGAKAAATKTKAGAQEQGPTGVVRLYIGERVETTADAFGHCDSYGNCYGNATKSGRNVSLEVTREVKKRCPSVITVTDNPDSADYVLHIEPGASTLYNKQGDAVYISPTRWRASNLAKDVCNFLGPRY